MTLYADSVKGNPIAGCIINMDKKIIGNCDSSTSFFSVSNGKHSFIVSKTGFKKKNFILTVQADTSIVIILESDIKDLQEVNIEAAKENNFGITRLNNVEGTAIYAGKKTEVVLIGDLNANLATNNQRQLFAKVAGINIFENDGAGLQLGIGGRGLNPNRVSNFNTRQNGYDISADALGYPESYYSPPSEAVERIEIIRGAASLQYGTQFGGFINFRFKNGDEAIKKFNVISRQTLGSFGFLNSFNSFYGKVKKLSYYTFVQYKQGTGWRPRSAFDQQTAHASLKYQINESISIKVEYTYNHYLAQQAGGLTDKDFYKDPSASKRPRNWFKVDWNLFATELNYKINDRTKLSWVSFGLLAGRDALGFLGRADRPDDTTKNRDLLQDDYKNVGSELRFLHRYKFLKGNSVFLIGSRYYSGSTYRKQGSASANSKPEFEYLHPDRLESSDYFFPSRNIAVFTENLWLINSRFSITPGLRYEYISTQSKGYYNEVNTLLNGDTIFFKQNYEKNRNDRNFVLAGVGGVFKPTDISEVYLNISQNYRSINFNDMRVINPNLKVDPNLKDEDGFTADMGYRVSVKNFFYADVSVFYLRYNNRIGTILKSDDGVQLYRLRTNISDSRNVGIESFAELNFLKLFKKNTTKNLSLFTNVSYIDARYIGSKEAAFTNKLVEFVPTFICRTGLSFKTKKFGTTLQYSYTAQQYSDASNTPKANDGSTGLIPAFYVMDWSVNYTWKWFTLASGLNNLTNNTYFTRRAEGYPGPGILPSDPINWYVTLQYKW
ncbi:MAG: TonB-dependent receptor [Bacteroidota bacterium]|nr:TonB-dependent receptor [Bacteroidota bacterium]